MPLVRKNEAFRKAIAASTIVLGVETELSAVFAEEGMVQISHHRFQ